MPERSDSEGRAFFAPFL